MLNMSSIVSEVRLTRNHNLGFSRWLGLRTVTRQEARWVERTDMSYTWWGIKIGRCHWPSSAAIPPPSAYAFARVRASRRSAARNICCSSAYVRVGFGPRLGNDLGGESDGRSGRLIELAGGGDDGCEGSTNEGDGEREEGGSEAGSNSSASLLSLSASSSPFVIISPHVKSSPASLSSSLLQSSLSSSSTSSLLPLSYLPYHITPTHTLICKEMALIIQDRILFNN